MLLLVLISGLLKRCKKRPVSFLETLVSDQCKLHRCF